MRVIFTLCVVFLFVMSLASCKCSVTSNQPVSPPASEPTKPTPVTAPSAAPAPSTSPASNDLRNTKWVLVDVPGILDAKPENANFSIRFGYHTIGGGTGCNTISGSYRTDGDKILMRVIVTEVGCPGEAFWKLQGAGLGALDAVFFKNHGDKLELFDSNSKLLANFKKDMASDVEGPRELILEKQCLEKTNYRVVSVNEKANRGIVKCGRDTDKKTNDKSTNTKEDGFERIFWPLKDPKPSTINGKWLQMEGDSFRFPLELTISDSTMRIKVNCEYFDDNKLRATKGVDVDIAIDGNVVYLAEDFVITNTSNKDKNNWCKLAVATDTLTFEKEEDYVRVRTEDGVEFGTFKRVK